jgi:AraC family transcriptional regulator of adaptative response / DNA-3-methyladenine glycosylase II
VSDAITPPLRLTADACVRALDARDARFDGLFFVGITSTHIYCRPVCPARIAHPEHRRFFNTAAAAEGAGYRPCLRCRPELAPGHALVDAVSRLARVAAYRIGAGALNGRSVARLADELGVSERHLRRALERAIGVSPLELAQTHRLLLAKRLLADTALPVTRIAYASGFQSLRRFNTVFRERYRMSPSTLRRGPRLVRGGGRDTLAREAGIEHDLFRLTLAYRAPFAWDEMLAGLARHTTPGVDVVQDGCYGRTVELGRRRGVVFVGNAPGGSQLNVEISASLLPALMPLLARLRQMFDLDAEPALVDEHLRQGGLGALVTRHPGLRVTGALDGFDVALRTLLGGAAARQRVTRTLGERIDSGIPALTHLSPGANRVAEAGVARLRTLGVIPRSARAIVSIAGAVAGGTLALDPGSDAETALSALRGTDGVNERLATLIVMRGLGWPDAFPAADLALKRAAGVSATGELRALAERWRPWRAYAAHHLWLADTIDSLACRPVSAA